MSAQPNSTPDRLCVGVVVGAHGIKGEVRIKSFTADPDDLDAYGPLSDEQGGRKFTVRRIGRGKGVVVCRIDGVPDRTAAEALKGQTLYIERNRLPAPAEDEFYHADLLGLAVEFPDGETVGAVAGLHDFGGGDVLEIRRIVDGVPVSGTVMVPFTRAAVPVVDVSGGRVVVERLEALFEVPTPAPKSAKAAPEPPEGDDWPEEDWK